MIDSHVHLDFDDLSKSLDSLIEACEKVSVNEFIVPSVSRANYSNVLALSKNYKQIHAAIGVHPWFVDDNNLQDLSKELIAIISENNIVAIGEIGLDKLKPDYALQLQFFERQLSIAQTENLPVIVHCVKAHQDVLRLMKKIPVSGVVHGWGGSIEQARPFVDLGLKLGIGGAITYPQRKKLGLAMQELPLDAMVLETDAPSMPLYGGDKTNTPLNIVSIASELAKLKFLSVKDVSEKLTQNTRALFSL